MVNSEASYIKECTKQIENKLGWPTSDLWKQRDFQNLSVLIETNTGTLLSVSTLRRIWQPEYKSTPQVATLDALAKFLEYDNWLSFCEHQRRVTTGKENYTYHAPKTFSRKSVVYSLVTVFLLVGILTFVFSTSTQTRGNLDFSEKNVRFNVKEASLNGIPNTVIFQYDVSELEADSFFIQQSWDPRMREPISKSGNTFTTTYYYPGPHKAKLIANNSVIKELELNISTNDWVAAHLKKPSDVHPVYIENHFKKESGKLHLSDELLQLNRLEVDKGSAIMFTYVSDSSLSADEGYTLTAQIKCDSLINISCPRIGLMILGSDDYHSLVLPHEGCAGEAMVKFGEKGKSGRNADLTELSGNVYNLRNIKIVSKDSLTELFIDERLVYSSMVDNSIGKILGWNFFFSGTGQINSFSFSTDKGTYQNL